MYHAASRTSASLALNACHGVSHQYFVGLADPVFHTISGVAQAYADAGREHTRDD